MVDTHTEIRIIEVNTQTQIIVLDAHIVYKYKKKKWTRKIQIHGLALEWGCLYSLFFNVKRKSSYDKIYQWSI